MCYLSRVPALTPPAAPLPRPLAPFVAGCYSWWVAWSSGASTQPLPTPTQKRLRRRRCPSCSRWRRTCRPWCPASTPWQRRRWRALREQATASTPAASHTRRCTWPTRPRRAATRSCSARRALGRASRTRCGCFATQMPTCAGQPHASPRTPCRSALPRRRRCVGGASRPTRCARLLSPSVQPRVLTLSRPLAGAGR